MYSFLVICPTILLLKLNVSSLCRTAELREKIETVNGEIQQLDMDLEEHQGKTLCIYMYIYTFYSLGPDVTCDQASLIIFVAVGRYA